MMRMLPLQALRQKQLQKAQKQIFNLVPRKIVTSCKKQTNCITLFGDTLYIGTRVSKLFIYQLLEDGELEEIMVMTPHCEIVDQIVANQKYFMTVPEVDDDCTVSVWETSTRHFLFSLKGHSSQISKALFLQQANMVATSSWDSTIRFWNLSNILEVDNPNLVIETEFPILAMQEISVSTIVYGGDDCYINFYNWHRHQQIGKYFAHTGSVTCIVPLGSTIVTCGGDHKFKIWSYSKQQIPYKEELSEHNQEKDMQVVSDQLNSMDSLQKSSFEIQKLSEIKINYDSTIFALPLNQKEIFYMDRHGVRFLLNKRGDILQADNDFKYNENICGIVRYGEDLIVASTNGQLRKYGLERGPNTQAETHKKVVDLDP